MTRSLFVCPSCGYHYHIGAYFRLSLILDSGSFRELDEALTSADPLEFPAYPEKLEATRQKTGMAEAVVTGFRQDRRPEGCRRRAGLPVFHGQHERGGGRKGTRLIEFASRNRLPLILFSASGGRAHPGGDPFPVQMAKTSAALARFSQRGGFYISVLTDPTTGGVTASFASLGDITLAEPGALIGFAGPRVIEQTIGQTLPEGFQRAEYLEEHGFVDQIVPRRQMRSVLSQLLTLHTKGGGAL